MTSLPDSIRFVKNALRSISMREHAPLLAMVDLRYQRWLDRKPLLLMKPKKAVDLKKCAAMYEVLLARLDNQYGDPARSSGLVKHIASFLGPRPNHVTDEAIQHIELSKISNNLKGRNFTIIYICYQFNHINNLFHLNTFLFFNSKPKRTTTSTSTTTTRICWCCYYRCITM